MGRGGGSWPLPWVPWRHRHIIQISDLAASASSVGFHTQNYTPCISPSSGEFCSSFRGEACIFMLLHIHCVIRGVWIVFCCGGERAPISHPSLHLTFSEHRQRDDKYFKVGMQLFFTALQPYKWTSAAANLLDEFIKVIQKNRRFILVSQGWAGRITSGPILIPVLRTSKIMLTFISNKSREIDEIVYLCQKTEKNPPFFFLQKAYSFLWVYNR